MRGGDDDVRLRKALTASLVVAALTALLLPLVRLPLPDLTQVERVPERIVRFIELDQHRPAPQPPPVQPPPPKQQEPLVAEQRPAEQPKAAPKPAVEEPKAVEPPRQRAQAAGILAFRDSFATIAERRPAAKLGAQARVGNTGESSAGPQRSMITSLAPGSSGGINLASFSRDVGGDGGGGGPLEGVEVGRVADAIGGAPGARPGAGGPHSGDGALAGRTDEEIQIVFDRYKAALYRLYNRELRNDSSLRGQVVLRLTIEPDGSVSMCRLQSTDMNAPALTEQVVERVKTFAFGAKDVGAITIVYPIDFLPAA
jgi:TonB family protein